jgi:hypothetical protein
MAIHSTARRVLVTEPGAYGAFPIPQPSWVFRSSFALRRCLLLASIWQSWCSSHPAQSDLPKEGHFFYPLYFAAVLDPPVRQAPHGNVKEPAVSGLHAEIRTLLQNKAMLSGDRQEIVGVMASNVPTRAAKAFQRVRCRGTENRTVASSFSTRLSSRKAC